MYLFPRRWLAVLIMCLMFDPYWGMFSILWSRQTTVMGANYINIDHMKEMMEK